MLQKITTIFLVAFTLVSCKNETQENGFVIEGNIDQPLDNIHAKLLSLNANQEVVLDSTTIKNGKLTLKGEVDSPDLYYLSIEGIPGYFPIIVENTKMTLEIYKDSIEKSVMSGSKENDLLKLYHQDTEALKMKNIELGQQFRTAQSEGDNERMNAIQAEFKQLMDLTNTKHIKLIKEQPDLVISSAILGNIFMSQGISKTEAREIFDTFSEDVVSSKFGKAIEESLSKVTVDVGSMAPNFSAPNPEGNILSLEDIKGKVTIIDFWAAWCGPCRKENPNLVKVYEKYKDKGLVIIGVSLDGSPKQKDPKAAWIEAIANDKLTWYQVSNLEFFNDPIARQYQIQSIPATFILDHEGTIVATNLRGDALDAKIAELLN